LFWHVVIDMDSVQGVAGGVAEYAAGIDVVLWFVVGGFAVLCLIL
jgi:hypothetical protein